MMTPSLTGGIYEPHGEDGEAMKRLRRGCDSHIFSSLFAWSQNTLNEMVSSSLPRPFEPEKAIIDREV